MKKNLWEATEEELTALLGEAEESRFRLNQIREWLFKKYVHGPALMTNLPGKLRDLLAEKFDSAMHSELKTVSRSSDGTQKLLLELFDGEAIEMAIIPAEERITFCLSTQAGCPVGCLFCASGANGLTRNLSKGEMIEELIWGIGQNGGRLPDNIVFMGIGEGLLNFENLSDVLLKLAAPEFFGMSPRRITVSTSGIAGNIYKLADLGREFTLAISLHAPDDATRKEIIPGPIRYPIAEIMAAADHYREHAGRMITLEYTLLDKINDSDAAARELARLAAKHHAKINLIPLNSTFKTFRRPPENRIKAFFKTVSALYPHVTIRRERGSDIMGACGQLRLGGKK